MTKTIAFTGTEKECCQETNGENVTVFGSSGNHDHGSSKVKLKNMVDYKWEIKNYPGRLIAVHNDGIHIGYVIKVTSKSSNGTDGVIRISNTVSGERALIRGMSGEVLDLQFASAKSAIILGSIDACSLFVHSINSLPNNITCDLMLKISLPALGSPTKYNRINWCPFVPENNEEDDDERRQQLVWVRNNHFYCLSTKLVIDTYGEGEYSMDDIQDGCIRYCDGAAPVANAIFSPDGTAIAVGGEDGHCRFYQVYFHTDERVPRCLHQWVPHDGKPITSFFFLDNLNENSAGKEVWKHAITASDNNSEIKLWCCESWECLQTIKFLSSTGQETSFKIELDRSASYLVLSDMQNKGMFVLQIVKQTDLNTSNGITIDSMDSSTERSRAFIKSIAEFPMSSPILSFSIVDAAVRKYKCAVSDSYLDNLYDYDDDASAVYCVVVHMYLIQPKSMQECNVLYQPTVPYNAEIKSTISNVTSSNSPELKESLGELNMSFVKEPNVESKKINLMSPNSFQSSGKHTPEGVSNEVFSTLKMLAKATTNVMPTTTNVLPPMKQIDLSELANHFKRTVIDEPLSQDTNGLINSEEMNQSKTDDNAVSGGSSPSREVQEILSTKDSDNINDSCDEHVMDDVGDFNLLDNMLIMDDNLLKTDEADVYDLETVDNDGTDWPISEIDSNQQNILPNGNANELMAPNEGTMTEVNYKLAKLIDLIQNQSTQIDDLSRKVAILEQTNKKLSESNGSVDNVRSDAAINKSLGDIMKQMQIMSQAQSASRQHIEGHLVNMPPTVTKDIVTIINQKIMPEISKTLNTMRNDLATNLTQENRKSVEKLMLNVKQELFGKEFTDLLLQAGESKFQNVYSTTLKQVIIPAFEKSVREMFQQIRDTFIQGSIAYTKQFEDYMAQYAPIQDNSKEVTKHLSRLPEQLKADLDRSIQLKLTHISNDINREIRQMHSSVVKTIKDNVKNEIVKGFESQVANIEDSVLTAVRSQAQTPAPTTIDIREQINVLLSQGQINKAFYHALHANDLLLVEYTLGKADINAVFDPCVLEQTVLLSLIQQISADMTNHTELKHKYVADALLNLNQQEAVTKEHAPKILQELYRNCQLFLKLNPTHSLCNPVKILQMAIQGTGIMKG